MAWLAVDGVGDEFIFSRDPNNVLALHWPTWVYAFRLPKGSIKKLIGRELTWADEPVELKDE